MTGGRTVKPICNCPCSLLRLASSQSSSFVMPIEAAHLTLDVSRARYPMALLPFVSPNVHDATRRAIRRARSMSSAPRLSAKDGAAATIDLRAPIAPNAVSHRRRAQTHLPAERDGEGRWNDDRRPRRSRASGLPRGRRPRVRPRSGPIGRGA